MIVKTSRRFVSNSINKAATYPDVVSSELAAHPRVEAAVVLEAGEGAARVGEVRAVVRGQAAHLTPIMPV